jgi:polysaccharide pyruvyl transferase WcaK-like protein
MNRNKHEDLENFRQAGRRPRIGLVSPYTGSNLGDAAIIEAARFQLSKLIQEVEFIFIVLDCKRVSELHGVESVPLAAVPLSFYFAPGGQGNAEVVTASARPESGPTAVHMRVRSLFKSIAGRVPLALPVARWARKAYALAAIEIRHLIQVRSVVRGLDGLIVAGGGQFDDEYGGPWGHPYSMFKWVRLARAGRVPVFFIGVGVCEIRRRLTRFFLRHTLERVRRVSLRDAGSLNILEGLHIKRELLSCPDLAFGLPFFSRPPKSARATPSEIPTIGLSPIVFGRPKIWPTENASVFDRYFDELKALAAALVETNHIIKVFATDDADYRLARKLYATVGASIKAKDRLELLPPLKLHEVLAALQNFDAVVASRLHGVILSHVRAVPVVAISYHRKVRVHMEDVRHERFCLDIHSFTASEAQRSLQALMANRDVLADELQRFCMDRFRSLEAEFGIVGGELASMRKALPGQVMMGRCG